MTERDTSVALELDRMHLGKWPLSTVHGLWTWPGISPMDDHIPLSGPTTCNGPWAVIRIVDWKSMDRHSDWAMKVVTFGSFPNQ